MANAVFQLDTLTCPTCVKKIETALNNLEGINSVKVLFNSSKVKVEFDETVLEGRKIESTLRRLGYSVLSSKIS